MRVIVLFSLMLLSGTGFSQDKKKCGQLPYAVVDTKPVLLSDMAKTIKETHPVSFADKTEHTGTYKVVVDCNGDVSSVMYREGNYTEQEEVWMFAQLKSADWKAGIKDEKEVSSTVFVAVKTTELKTEITIE